MSASNLDLTGELIPVSLLTGFLGSGKTTLLNRLLHDPAMAETLVLINEFGEIGLDHHLVQSVDAEMIVMASGCLCCTVQSDLSDTLRCMAIDRVRGKVPHFRRVVIETTGLADPAPILHTLMQDPMIAAHYRLDGVITTVDAVHGIGQIERQPEAAKQAAVADRLVMTKRDLATDADMEELTRRLATLNPAAPILATDVPIARLFDAGLYDPGTKSLEVRRWLQAETYGDDHHHDHGHDHDHHAHDQADQSPADVNRHDARIRATCITIDEPLPWEAFVSWIESIADQRGEDLLRLKALLNVAGRDKPIVVHGVQHLFHPPVELASWPDDDHRSRIVVIARDLPPAMLEDALRKVIAATGGGAQ
jgi:G3E family GTPase